MKIAQAQFNVNLRMIYTGAKGLGNGFINEVVNQLVRARDRHGCTYGAMDIDSLDWLVGNHVAAQNLNTHDHKRGVILEALPQFRRRIGARFGVPVWITNQLAWANLVWPSTTGFDHSQGGDSKDWGRPLDNHGR
jgi:hypothetical protein